MEPITPSQVAQKKNALIPDFIIESVNQMIAKNWSGSQAKFLQDELMDLVLLKNPDITRREIFDEHYFDFEGLFRSAGWVVEYDSPGYNESYKASFTFSKKS